MKSLICLFYLVIVLSGCTQKINEKTIAPVDLIPRDQMIDIIVDLKIMDAVLASKQRNRDQDVHEMKYYLHQSVMEKYGITRDQFERSMSYYQKDLKSLDRIYEEALNKLSKMKSEENKND